jgi:phenylalanyl-tRNA synthetase alpha chain
MSSILDELSDLEKRVLIALEKKDSQNPEEIMRKGGFSQLVEVMNASSWLQTKELVTIEEDKKVFYFLSKKQYGVKGLPERRILTVLEKEEGIMYVKDIPPKTKLDQREVSPALGWLKKKGWANIGKDEGETFIEITEKGKENLKKKGADEQLVEQLLEGELESTKADADLIKQLKSRKGTIGEKEVVTRTIALTEKGKEVIKMGVKIKPLTVQVTAELLQSGKWKDVEFRRYDINAFAPSYYGPKPHPMNRIIEDIIQIFLEMGFTQIKGDYVESAFWNMDTLFIPQDHPARELQDTIYLDNPKEFDITKTQKDPEFYKTIKAVHENGGETGSAGWKYDWEMPEAQKALLRTHTTVNTIRALYENPEPPLKVFSIERVFRKESIDSTHLPEFYQIEGIIHEEGASFAMLQGVLKEFYSRMGFPDIRLRPAYFPYTEPSMEVEAKFQGRWLELGGSGIFRPEVTLPLGVKYPVLAWGLGLERLAMLLLGVNDIRDLYISDIKWLKENPTFYRR